MRQIHPSIGDPAAEGLAVVIPGYKSVYLKETLAAFAAQTDRRFRLYVGDDGSPDDLESVVAPFRGQLDLVYHRFPENLGRRSLARQWDRAIALSTERWVWLFSDDDLASPDCVAAFWSARAARPAAAGLHRFQCRQVDCHGQPLRHIRYCHFPEHQTWEDHVHGPAARDPYYFNILQNVIFPRELYLRHGGFYDYPLGLWSDFITWARFARDEGFYTLPGGMVFSRVHNTSIGGGIFYAGGDRCELLRTAGRMFADFRQLYAEVGRRPPQWEFMGWFARLFQHSPIPLSVAERAAAADALRLGWPGWPVVREWAFWSRAGRPILKQQRWFAVVARLRRALQARERDGR